MADLAAVRSEVVLIVSSLVRTLLLGVGPAAEKGPLQRLEPRAEDELGAAEEKMCLEAVDEILKILEANLVRQEEAPPEDRCGGSGRRPTGEGEAGVQDRSPERASILLSTSHAGASGGQQGALQSASRVEGEEAQVRRHSSCPPSQSAEHDYALPAAPPPHAASAAAAGVRRCRRGRQSAGAHLQCSQCSQLFPSAERLAEHQSRRHPVCAACGAAFGGVLKLREHRIREHGLLPYACSYCPKTFNHKAHCALHEKARHTGHKAVHCDVCGKGYTCGSVLRTHRVTHFSKAFVCEVCGKAFHHAAHLTRHSLVHQQLRPYSCSTCGRSFTQAANLRSHQAGHARERQLCSVCGRSFRRLKNHVISKHPHELPAGERPPAAASCQVCGKSFPSASRCEAHRRRHGGERPTAARCAPGPSAWPPASAATAASTAQTHRTHAMTAGRTSACSPSSRLTCRPEVT